METQNYFIHKILCPKMKQEPHLCLNDVKAKYIVDTSIYTANRAFRTSLSFKAGGNYADAFRITSTHTLAQGLVTSHLPKSAYTLSMQQLKRTNTIERFLWRQGPRPTVSITTVGIKRKQAFDSECASKKTQMAH